MKSVEQFITAKKHWNLYMYMYYSTIQARLEGDLPYEMVSVIQLVDLAGSKSIHNAVSMLVC